MNVNVDTTEQHRFTRLNDS